MAEARVSREITASRMGECMTQLYAASRVNPWFAGGRKPAGRRPRMTCRRGKTSPRLPKGQRARSLPEGGARSLPEGERRRVLWGRRPDAAPPKESVGPRERAGYFRSMLRPVLLLLAVLAPIAA